jgi:hypothetical protein
MSAFIEPSSLKSMQSLDEEKIEKIRSKYNEKFRFGSTGKKKGKMMSFVDLMPWRKHLKEVKMKKSSPPAKVVTPGFYSEIYLKEKPHKRERPGKNVVVTTGEILKELRDHQLALERGEMNGTDVMLNQDDIPRRQEKTVIEETILKCPRCGLSLVVDEQALSTWTIKCSCGHEFEKRKQDLERKS